MFFRWNRTMASMNSSLSDGIIPYVRKEKTMISQEYDFGAIKYKSLYRMSCTPFWKGSKRDMV